MGTFERERKRRRSSFYNKRTIKRQRGEDKIKMASTSPAQLAAQMLGSLARVGAFVGVGATAVASALYDVDGGERAVMFDRFRGVLETTSGEGTHFMVPDSIADDLRRAHASEESELSHRHERFTASELNAKSFVPPERGETVFDSFKFRPGL